ncbi:MAG: hypothetical protein WCB36_13005 [Burkholderiales bacterium]
MLIQGALLVLCTSALFGCVVYPAHLRITPRPLRLDVVVPVSPGGGYYNDGNYNGGYYNGEYNNGGAYHRDHNGR